MKSSARPANGMEQLAAALVKYEWTSILKSLLIIAGKKKTNN